MATTKQFYLHGLQFGDDSSWITQLTDLTPAANIDYLTARSAGAVVPSFRGGQNVIPDITFTTTQVKKVLDKCASYNGLYLPLSASYVDLYYRAVTNLGMPTAIASGVHLQIRARRCVMYWTAIRAQQGQPATIDCRIVPTWDNTNAPLLATDDQAIPASALATEQFTMGPVKLNGSLIDGSDNWGLELNPQIEEIVSDGDVFPTFVGCREHDPILTVANPDIEKWDSGIIGLGGLQVTTLLFWLRKKTVDQTGNVANATEEHISFTGADNPCGMATVENINAGIDGPAVCNLRVGLRISNTATAYPLTIDTTAAIA